MKHVFLLWKNATMEANDVLGVVEIDEHDLARLVADVYQDISGESVAHVELRGVVTSPELLYSGLPRLDVGQEVTEDANHAN